jgi:hypothetical protein
MATRTLLRATGGALPEPYALVEIPVPQGFALPRALGVRPADPTFNALVLNLGAAAAAGAGGALSRYRARVEPATIAPAAEERIGAYLRGIDGRIGGLEATVGGVVRAFGGSSAAGTIGSAPERGAAGEEILGGRLEELYPTADIVAVGREARRGDFRMTLPGALLLVESKNVQRVSKTDVDKFRRDLAEAATEGVGAGLFVSLRSKTVPHRGAFAIEASPADARPAVYVAGVLEVPDRLKMGVEVAAFLARNWGGRDGGGQTDARRRLLDMAQKSLAAFEAQAAGLRAARRHLAQLQDIVGGLEAALSAATAAVCVLADGERGSVGPTLS